MLWTSSTIPHRPVTNLENGKSVEQGEFGQFEATPSYGLLSKIVAPPLFFIENLVFRQMIFLILAHFSITRTLDISNFFCRSWWQN